MRIFYGIQAGGFGHLYRSTAVIKHLRPDHEVVVFTGTDANLSHFRSLGIPTVAITSGNVIATDSKVAAATTLASNLSRVHTFGVTIRRLLREMNAARPDIVVSDLEPFVHYAARAFGVPSVSLCHNPSMLCLRTDFPISGRPLDRISNRVALRLLTGSPAAFIIPNLTQQEPIRRNVLVVPPIIDQDVATLEPSDDGFALLYECRFNRISLQRLARMPIRMVAFSDAPSHDVPSNVEVRPYNRSAFLRCLARCSFLVNNGGFTSSCEAIYLRKPLYMIPIKGLYEQYHNAKQVESLGFGRALDRLDAPMIERFLEEAPRFRRRLAAYAATHPFARFDGAVRCAQLLTELPHEPEAASVHHGAS